MRKSIHILTAAVCALGAFSAQAATLCVDKVNPACFTGATAIQDAVDAAVAGDIIKIGAGTFKEAVTVATAGITLAGQNATKTIIDSAGLAAPGIAVTVANVTVSGLSVNNSPADGVSVTGDGFTFNKAAVNTTSADCLVIAGMNAKVLASRLSACGAGAATLTGDNALIQGNRILNSPGVDLTGSSALLEKNTCENMIPACFSVGGDDAIVRSNKALQSGVLFATGNNATVQSNTSTNGFGALVTGDNPKLLSNRATGNSLVLVQHFTAVCMADCSGARVIGNTSIASAIFGVLADFDAPGGIVQSNTVTSAQLLGYIIDGASTAQVLSNKAASGVFGGGAGIIVTGTGAKTLTSNSARNTGFHGFLIDGGPGHLLQKNTATGNSRDGFNLDAAADSVTMLQNTATGNTGEGIENNSVSGNFIGNIVKTNRAGSDFCENGTTTVQTIPQLQSLNTLGSPVAAAPCIP